MILGQEVKPFLLLIAEPFLQAMDFERLELFLTVSFI